MYGVPNLVLGIKEDVTGNAKVVEGMPPLSMFLSVSHYRRRAKKIRKNCISFHWALNGVSFGPVGSLPFPNVSV